MAVKTVPIVLLGLVLAFPSLSVQGASEGLLLWYQTVLPALAPFLILTQLLTVSGGAELLVKPVYPLFHRLFHVSVSGAFADCSAVILWVQSCAAIIFVREKSHKKKRSISLPSAAIPAPCSFLATSDSSFLSASLPCSFCFPSAFRFLFCPFWHKSCIGPGTAARTRPPLSAGKQPLSAWNPFFYPLQKPWSSSADV